MIDIKNKLIKITFIATIVITILCITKGVNAETTIKMKQGLLNNNEQITFKKVDIDKINTGNIDIDHGMKNKISKVFGIVQYICFAGAVIIVSISGVKYMLAAPDEKADIKKQAIALVIGASIIFSISTILRIIAAITRASIS